MTRRSGLGRGLAALIPAEPSDGPAASATGDAIATAPASTSAMTLADIRLDAIAPNPRQPRASFDADELEGLAASIRDVGVLQPVVVRPVDDGRYELVAGERRWRAAGAAGLDTIPAIVRHTDDNDLLKQALIENIHRVQLNPLEEASAYQQLLDDFGVNQEELASRLGKSRPVISNALRLLTLPAGVQRRVAAGVLTPGHARALMALDTPAKQERVATRVVTEGLSVRSTEEAVRLSLMDPGTTSAAAHDRSAAARRPAKVTAPGLLELQHDLSDALDCRVHISMGAKRGRLQIEFGTVDDLERVVGVIADGLRSRADATDGDLRQRSRTGFPFWGPGMSATIGRAGQAG